MNNCIIEMKGIKKYFYGVKALDGVDFQIRTGEVHALIGENGAGKSTLVKILTGVYQPTAGTIILNDKPTQFPSPQVSQKAGISAIHQEATMFPDLSITENIFMGHHIRNKSNGLLSWREMKDKTQILLDKLELDIRSDTKVRNLSVAQRHMVEIAKALSLDAKIVIMDEPTSALTLKEVEYLYKIIRKLKSEGKAIIFISHKFEEVFEIADYFTVLRDGKYIGEGTIADITVDKIVQMVIGRSLEQMYPKLEAEKGDIILKVENLTKIGVFKNISFDLHKGEILGFFGLVGAGRSEVMQTIFGIDTKTSGEVFIDGEKVYITNPSDAMNFGLAYLPEDRQIQGAILAMNIRENITLPIIDGIGRYIFLDRNREFEITDEYGKYIEIRASGWEQLVEDLSGGNQQKVVLAKWIATKPRILIMDESTKGIDVATKATVHNFVSELAKKGIAIILISSELPEILGMSNNVIVMHEGVITAKFTREEANSKKIIRAAIGSISK
ncbi:sugar ABC transporter ATP-binding protein [bacterium]|nr:sugar ABC transporter ATP-binding protein [bacterium]MBU4362505.1 sugar ABC transporter ATP-binding protein [bacterium]MBU4602094.1 sugar ABC transporter ATP-binding protein [bacterium]